MEEVQFCEKCYDWEEDSNVLPCNALVIVEGMGLCRLIGIDKTNLKAIVEKMD